MVVGGNVRSEFSFFQCLCVDLIFLTTKEPPNVNREGLVFCLPATQVSPSYATSIRILSLFMVTPLRRHSREKLSLEIVDKQKEYSQ